MSTTHIILASAAAIGGLGMWLMLPRGGARGRRLGIVLALASLALLGSRMSLVGDWTADAVLGVLALVTVVAGVGAITCRSPVYCALWFALSLLGTASLFLFQGAQFLGVATIVVYAGAILVTFLFVLMLTQTTGREFFDRISWEAALSSAAGAVLVGLLTMTITQAVGPQAKDRPVAQFNESQLQADGGVLTTDHVARIGAELFSRRLIAVEVAGTLLLVALVGAVAIVAQNKLPASMAGAEEGHSHG